MIGAYKKFLLNYGNFSGRSTRSDYWYVVLANLLISFVLSAIAGFVPKLEILSGIYSLATFIPGIAIVVRRLHDINKSGWNYLMLLIPLVGWIILIVYLCKDSVEENNKYGARV